MIDFAREVVRSRHFSAEHLARRTFCVNALKDFQQAGVKAWDALAEIKEKKLYWPHDSVKEFCRAECGWTDGRFYQLVRASKVRASLPNDTIPLVLSERQARELVKVPESQRVEVLNEITKNSKISAKSIKTAASKVLRQKETGERASEVINGSVDANGNPIPVRASVYWNRKDEAKAILGKIRCAKWAIQELNSDDPMYCEVNLNGVLSDLNNAIGRFGPAIPAHVCPYCKGDGCKNCKQRGVVSKYFWDTAVPMEMKPEQPF